MPELATPVATRRRGVELIIDWTQIGQVSPQPGRLEVRSAAVKVAGELGPARSVGYRIGIDYNGFDVDPERTWTLSDFNLTFAVPQWRTRFSIGQMREDFGYEVVAFTNLAPQRERQISPFVSPVNFGAKIIHVLGAANEMTVSYGIGKLSRAATPHGSACVTLLCDTSERSFRRYPRHLAQMFDRSCVTHLCYTLAETNA